MLVDLSFLRNCDHLDTMAVSRCGSGALSLLSGPEPDATFDIVLSVVVPADLLPIGATVEATLARPGAEPDLVIDGEVVLPTAYVINIAGWHGAFGPLTVEPPR